MASKKQILKNVESFSTEQLADAIRQGIVTMFDLTTQTEGRFGARAKQDLLKYLNSPERYDWDICKKNDSIPALESFLRKYPSGSYAEEAQKRLYELNMSNNCSKSDDSLSEQPQISNENTLNNSSFSNQPYIPTPQIDITNSFQTNQDPNAWVEPRTGQVFSTSTPQQTPEWTNNGINNQDNPINANNQENSSLNNQEGETKSNQKSNSFVSMFSFKGRIGRLEFFLSWFVYILINIIVRTLSFYIGYNSVYYDLEGGAIILLILVIPLYIASLWFGLSQAARRCHDMGYSGWMQLIPIFNPFVLFFAKGEPFVNKFGPAQK